MKSITLRHPAGDDSTGRKTKRIGTGVMQSFTALLILCAKQAIVASRKLKDNSKISSESAVIQRPKKLIATISSKAMGVGRRRRRNGGGGTLRGDGGDDGVWRREILMGDKCQPLDFSGVIYYDRDGKRTDEFPMRSPRASPFPGYVAKFDWVPPHER